MLRKKIDRYVSVAFLLRFFGVLLLVGMLFTVFDVVKRTEELRGEGITGNVSVLVAYYGNVLPMFLLDIVPGVVLVAGGMVMVRMAQNRELLALKASGASIYRVTAPVFGWALLISMAGFALQEALGPHMARRREVLRHELEGRTDSDLLVREPRHHRKLFVGRYNFATRQMESISLMEFHDDGMLKRILRADKGSLEPEGQIRLQTVEEQEFDTSGVPVAMPGIRAQVTRDTSITQMDLVRAAEESREEGMMLLGLSDLHARMQRNPTIPFFRVAFHARLASFFSPLILLLVGLPCLIGFERSVHSRFFSVVLSILLAGGLYALTFLFTSMGTSGMLPPVLAGWLPVIITAAGGLYLFQSILT